MSLFFNFFMKTPCSHAHDWSKKRKFCQNYTLLWAKKINRMPFFSDVHEKITAFAHILLKKRLLKKTFFSCRYFVKKRPFSQKQNSLMTFFQICHENSLLSSPYLVKKTSNLSKLNYIIGPKSQ